MKVIKSDEKFSEALRKKAERQEANAKKARSGEGRRLIYDNLCIDPEVIKNSKASFGRK